MYQNPMITISPMQSKLFSQAKKMATPKHFRSALTFNTIPLLESNVSRVTTNSSNSYNSNSHYGGSLTLSHLGSQLSNFSKISNKSSIRNSYIHTEYDEDSKRVKSSFFASPAHEYGLESGIYTGQQKMQQSIISQDNYKRRFYNQQHQLKPGVIYNKYYGPNDTEIEEFEETSEPFNYFKVISKYGNVISTSSVRPHQVVSMLQNNQFLPSN